jgi:hypothetical protein
VALLALLTFFLQLVSSLLGLRTLVLARPLFWIGYLLSLVSFVWMGIMLTEACVAIGNRLNRKTA